MSGLGDLDHDTARFAEAAGASDRIIGAFKGFDRQYGAFPNDYGLADIQRARRLGNLKAQFNVCRFTFRGGPPRKQPGFGHVGFHEERGGRQFNADLLHIRGHGAEDGFGVPRAELFQQCDQLGIETDPEEVGRCDLPRHDRVLNARLLEFVEHVAILAQPDPVHLVDEGLDLRARFLAESNRDQALHALLPGRFGQHQRIGSPPGDNSNSMGYVGHRVH